MVLEVKTEIIIRQLTNAKMFCVKLLVVVVKSGASRFEIHTSFISQVIYFIPLF